MGVLLIKSNHGNHRGFNRKWTVLNNFESKDEACEYLAEYANDLEYDSLGDQQYDYLESYEYDLIYYVVVTREDYFNGIFNGGSMGYATNEIIDYFETIEND